MSYKQRAMSYKKQACATNYTSYEPDATSQELKVYSLGYKHEATSHELLYKQRAMSLYKQRKMCF